MTILWAKAIPLIVPVLALGAPVPDKNAALKTDAQVAQFLVEQIRKDRSLPEWVWAAMLDKAEVPLEITRQDENPKAAAFKKRFASLQLWLVRDKTVYFPGPAFSWLLAVDRQMARAYLIGTNRGQIFQKNLSALFTSAEAHPKDQAEALELGELIVTLIRYAGFSRDTYRKDLSEKDAAGWNKALLAKFTLPRVKQDKSYRITIPVYEQIQPRKKTLITYEIDLGEKGELNVKTESQPIK